MVAALGIRPTLSTKSLAHRSAHTAACGRVDIRVASIEKGLGAFATCDIPFGAYIGEYSGELLTKKQVQGRYWGKREPDDDDLAWLQSRRDRSQGITGNYVLEMKHGSFVDLEDADCSTWCRFMNHASTDTPQCNVKVFDQLTIDGDVLICPKFFAIRDIKIGEELSWDYGPLFFTGGTNVAASP
jgi:SET domain-containing protein